MKWYLVQVLRWDKPYWLSDYNEHYWSNISGGKIPKSEGDKIFETAVAEYEDLDHTKTGLVKKESNVGWLSRSGVWHPCDSLEHDIYAYYILKKTISELEETGWVRVGYIGWSMNHKRRLSAEQRNWLCYHGHIVGDYD
jgi:hypothetical protein